MADVDEVVAWLQRKATKGNRDALARYGIPATHALGVTIGELKAFSKTLGRDQSLAESMWKTGIYEARMLASFVGEPARVSSKLMDAWMKDFDNWAVCDQVCFQLFDRTPHAWKKVHAWAGARGEFQRRAAFALLWALAAHDKNAGDEAFLEALPLIEKFSSDERDYVKKAIDMALRAVGRRKSPAMRKATRALATRLSASADKTQSWIGRSALRDYAKKG